MSGRPKIRRALHPQMDRALMSPTQVTYSQPPGTVIGVPLRTVKTLQCKNVVYTSHSTQRPSNSVTKVSLQTTYFSDVTSNNVL